MNFHHSYVPKNRKVNYKIVVPFVLLVALLVFSIISIVLPKEQKQTNQNLAFCGLNPKRAQELLSQDLVDQTRVFEDYGVYGETLGIYESDYLVGDKDPLLGKTIYVRNLCNPEDEFSFLMGSELDSKIPIEQLSNGFYAVEILNGLERQRFVSAKAVQDQFTSLSHNNEVKTLDFIADKDAFKNEDDFQLDDNYLYFLVQTQTMPEEQYDIVIDPGGLTLKDNGDINYGAKRKEIVEADETYLLAQGVKKILEEKGLKVKLLRDHASPIEQFGKGSRTEIAYATQAKYYFQFNLQFSFYKPDKGMTILYSNYATNGLANSIMEALNAVSDLPTSNFTTKNNLKGVFKTRLNGNTDGRDVISEMGGQFTGAGRKDAFTSLHAEYKEHNKGMQVVSIDYGFINDDITYDSWINQNEAIIEATAKGILKGLRID